MELMKSRERTEHPVAGHDAIVEHAWLLKSQMRWVRDDRSPVNAIRWRVWDRMGTGRPPSRVVTKAHSTHEPRGCGPGATG
jgi:hypothetical protein